MREHRAIKIGHFSIFKLNFLYQKSTEALWKWFSSFNMWIVEQLWLMTYYHMMQFWSTLFCKNVPKFWWLCAHWFWKIWKNHLAPINMDLKDYSIFGAYLQIVLPWITILHTLSTTFCLLQQIYEIKKCLLLHSATKGWKNSRNISFFPF